MTGSCSVIWRSEIYFFGGYGGESKTPTGRVLKLSEGALKKLGSVGPFFVGGACG